MKALLMTVGMLATDHVPLTYVGYCCSVESGKYESDLTVYF